MKRVSGGKRIKLAPHKAIDGDHDQRHHDSCGQQQPEVSGVCGLTDYRAPSGRRDCLSAETEVFSHDTCVPGATRGGHSTRDEIRKDSRQQQFPPPLDRTQPICVADFLQVLWKLPATQVDFLSWFYTRGTMFPNYYLGMTMVVGFKT